MNRESKRRTIDAAAWIAAVAVAAIVAGQARAKDLQPPSATNPSWLAECGSCHVAYPPRLLPAQSWRTIVQQLDRHFGVDASIDASAASTITQFLEANAAPAGSKRADASTLRITQTRWFRHEHGEIAGSTWDRPSIRSAANCAACHRGADSGDFSERLVRVPN